jgi:hypothetical protein
VYALRAARADDEPLIGECVLSDMAHQMLDLHRPEDALEGFTRPVRSNDHTIGPSIEEVHAFIRGGRHLLRSAVADG